MTRAGCLQHAGDLGTETPAAVVTSAQRGAFSFIVTFTSVKCITKVCGDGYSIKSIITLNISLCNRRALGGLCTEKGSLMTAKLSSRIKHLGKPDTQLGKTGQQKIHGLGEISSGLQCLWP